MLVVCKMFVIVYVFCNFVSFVCDVKILCEVGWMIDWI